jgi:acylphosphatase
MKHLSATIHGYVQGVSFRAYTQAEATRLGLTGWVANQGDGSVHVEAEGSDSALQEFVAWLHRGSPSAQVTHVEVSWSDAAGKFHRFFVQH